MTPRELALKRSGGHCEAMVLLGPTGVWTRCGARNVEVHHAITRARGGLLLDEVGEHYHLIVLCQQHHRGAEDGAALEGALLIDGYVLSDLDGYPRYYGTDRYLTEKYG